MNTFRIYSELADGTPISKIYQCDTSEFEDSIIIRGLELAYSALLNHTNDVPDFDMSGFYWDSFYEAVDFYLRIDILQKFPDTSCVGNFQVGSNRVYADKDMIVIDSYESYDEPGRFTLDDARDFAHEILSVVADTQRKLENGL